MLNSHGMVMAFDAEGNQIPELQLPFYELWARYAEELGYDLRHAQVAIEMPARKGLLRHSQYGWRVD